MILPHLTDPEERRLVKEELARRYVEHYRGLGVGGEGQGGPEPVAATGAADEAVAAVAAEEQGFRDGSEASEPSTGLTADLPELPEVTPIALTTPNRGTGSPSQERPTAASAKKRCFIATAAYGSPLAPEVNLLREFRDRRLCGRWWGEGFLRLYYRLSPRLAEIIHQAPERRRLVRLLLTPLVGWLKNRGIRWP